MSLSLAPAPVALHNISTSCKVNGAIMSAFLPLHYFYSQKSYKKWLTHICVHLPIFFEIFLFHEITWLSIKKFWYLVYVVSWNKKVLTRTGLEITWVGTFLLWNSMKKKVIYKYDFTLFDVKSQLKLSLKNRTRNIYFLKSQNIRDNVN